MGTPTQRYLQHKHVHEGTKYMHEPKLKRHNNPANSNMPNHTIKHNERIPEKFKNLPLQRNKNMYKIHPPPTKNMLCPQSMKTRQK